jgi:hypothetical protein
MGYVEVACRFAVGVVFVVSAASKLRGAAALREFVRSLRRMDVLPPAMVGPVAAVVVAAEVVVVALLVMPVTAGAVAGFALAALLLAGFGVAIVVSVRRGRRVACRCFGSSATPLGPWHLVRNAALLAVAGLGLAAAGLVATSPAPVVVAAMAGLLVGGLATATDDLVELFRPVAHRTR